MEEFISYPCSLGTVVGVEDGVYIIATTDGRTIGIRANSDAIEANVDADILSPAADPTPVRTISKLTLKQRLDTLNKWADFKQLLSNYGLWDDFVVAQDLRTDHPMFTQYKQVVLLSLDISEEQFQSLVL